ncbi:MAG: 30S ribosomal protein S20, partial [Candidatus Zixiibacteriota bacterium]
GALKAVTEAKSFDEASRALPSAVAALDYAAGKSLIHKNMAGRKKARLYAHVARLKG